MAETKIQIQNETATGSKSSRNNSRGKRRRSVDEEASSEKCLLLSDEGNEQSNQQQPATNETTPVLTFEEDRMKQKLRFFYMNPIEKWRAKRRFPYKFIVQVIKIILVTFQLCVFASNNYMHVNYAGDNRIAFSHLFLKGWEVSYEVPSYPPASGPLALYEKDDIYHTIDYALDGYYNLDKAVGSYSYVDEENKVGPVVLCMHNYKKGIIFGFNESYVFDSEIVETCVNITHESHGVVLGSKKFLEDKNITVDFASLVKARLKFSVKTVNLKAAGPMTPPDCYQFDIAINFDNRDFDGQMLLSLDAEPQLLTCKGDTEYITDNWIESVYRTMINLLVILICSTSFVLCSRAIYRAQKLRTETVRFFKVTYNKSLSFNCHMEFLNLWYVMMIVNDLLIIVGSAMKDQIERRNSLTDQWNLCSIFLGLGNLLVWFGVLRYLGFFKTYNVVILTLKKATPKVARFLLCAILIYAGFTFCGWLVLGPYHIKFRSLSITSECLFSLINGDDMFATFTIATLKSTMLWWFSRIYLYSFIVLYIYVILSLFISVIMDAYDTIKAYYRKGFPKTELQKFAFSESEEVPEEAEKNETKTNEIKELFYKACCCGNNKHTRYGSFSESGVDSVTTSEPEGVGAICI